MVMELVGDFFLLLWGLLYLLCLRMAGAISGVAQDEIERPRGHRFLAGGEVALHQLVSFMEGHGHAFEGLGLYRNPCWTLFSCFNWFHWKNP
jgi:hypothetical protein